MSEYSKTIAQLERDFLNASTQEEKWEVLQVIKRHQIEAESSMMRALYDQEGK